MKQEKSNILGRTFDIIVAGGGHAGIEASLGSARLGLRTALITSNKFSIGKMSCNPAIGGLAKGHLVREIDALGGEMAKLIDRTGIHFKVLNKSKGPAVWSPRAQADRQAYSFAAKESVFNQKGLTVIEDTVISPLVRNGKIVGARLKSGNRLMCKALIICAGTFLNGKLFRGLQFLPSGRAGEPPTTRLTENLQALGFKSGRLKTGTPPRIVRSTINFTKLEEQKPDIPPSPFSFQTDRIRQQQTSCFITFTNSQTHKILESGLDRSPLYAGLILGVGPRYCPSIEDKIVRFADRDRHQIFLEPEGFDNPEMYVNGFSTSLPEDIQKKALRSIRGLENVEIAKLGYAIEYDFFPSYQLNPTLETKLIDGLYFAGQINGTSGYEEAAAQGLIAGINAALKIKNQSPLILDRSDAYIGVLIDDLVNKTILEPYRMFTSRAEFRLLLRHDNADLRLMDIGHRLGLISTRIYKKLTEKKEQIRDLSDKINRYKISPELFNSLEGAEYSKGIRQSKPLKQIIKRPEIKLSNIIKKIEPLNHYLPDVVEHVDYITKYQGYLKRQETSVLKFKQLENKRIPADFDFSQISSLSAEAREKLAQIKPASLGQASRIPGVRNGDLSVLIIYLEKHLEQNNIVSCETLE